MKRSEVLKSLVQNYIHGKSLDPIDLSNSLSARDIILPWLSNPLLFEGLELGKWPTKIKNAYLTTLQRNETQLFSYRQIKEALRSTNVEAVPIKGIWMLDQGITLPGQRDFCDIDLWCREDASVAEALLKENNFTEWSPLHNKLHFHSKFRKESKPWPIYLELHRDLTQKAYNRIDSEEIWLGKAFGHLQLEDHFIYMLYHSALDFYSNCTRILDCALVMQKLLQEGMNLFSILDKVHRWKIKRWFLFSILNLEWALGEQVLSQEFESKDVFICKKYHKKFLDGIESADGEKGNYIANFQLSDSAWLGASGLGDPRRIISGIVDRWE